MISLDINEEFLEKRPLSYSSLKHFRKSPKHYIKYLTEPRVSTDATLQGSVIDCLVLTPEMFEKRFMIFNKPNTRTNKGKAELLKMETIAMQNKLTLVTQEMVDVANRAKESLYYHADARVLLEHMTKTQVKIQWRDRATKLPLIGYVDFETRCWGEHFIVDLKSTRDADPDEFIRDIFKFDYELQCGAYRAGYMRTKFAFPYFIFLCVETSEPFNVSVNFCEPKFIEASEQEFYGALRAFRYCMDNHLFDKGYEFWLFGTKQYHAVRMPGYWKSKTALFNAETYEGTGTTGE